ncbi:MAG: glycosyltransferase, partial [Bacillota bacterium]
GTGYLAAAKKPEDIANKTIKMIEHSKETRKQMGRAGRKVINNNFSFTAQTDKLVNYYLV